MYNRLLYTFPSILYFAYPQTWPPVLAVQVELKQMSTDLLPTKFFIAIRLAYELLRTGRMVTGVNIDKSLEFDMVECQELSYPKQNELPAEFTTTSYPIQP